MSDKTRIRSAALDHPRIWLQNAADAEASGEGRLWCEDNVWPVDENDGEPTEYVRADIVDDLVAACEALVEACDNGSPLQIVKNVGAACDLARAALFSYRKQGE